MNGFNANKWGVHMGTNTNAVAAIQCEKALSLSTPSEKSWGTLCEIINVGNCYLSHLFYDQNILQMRIFSTDKTVVN